MLEPYPTNGNSQNGQQTDGKRTANGRTNGQQTDSNRTANGRTNGQPTFTATEIAEMLGVNPTTPNKRWYPFFVEVFDWEVEDAGTGDLLQLRQATSGKGEAWTPWGVEICRDYHANVVAGDMSKTAWKTRMREQYSRPNIIEKTVDSSAITVQTASEIAAQESADSVYSSAQNMGSAMARFSRKFVEGYGVIGDEVGNAAMANFAQHAQGAINRGFREMEDVLQGQVNQQGKS